MKPSPSDKELMLQEFQTAKKAQIWGDAGSDVYAFVEKLIECGDSEEAKVDGRIPLPKPPSSTPAKKEKEIKETLPDSLSHKDAVRYSAKCSRENSGTTRFSAALAFNKQSVEIESHKECDVENALKAVPDGAFGFMIFWTCEKEESTAFRKDTKPTKRAINEFFGFFTEDGKKLEQWFEDRLWPLKPSTDVGLAIEEARLKYVTTEPEDSVERYFVAFNQQPDKRSAIVVAGESGSGKSVFACKAAVDSGFLPLYVAIGPKLLEEVQKPDMNDFPNLRRFIDDDIIPRAARSDLDALYKIKEPLNSKRDKWASDMLEAAIMSSVERSPECKAWFERKWQDQKKLPKKVAIIVDEAVDVDLVEGLIATSWNMASYSYLAQDKVQLVLVGVGLDNIKESGYVGTNPRLSNLVVMKQPNISILEKEKVVGEEVAVALTQGLFPNILKTNARMFFRSILPLLKFPIHAVDAVSLEPEQKKARLQERLIEIGSYRCLMDHGPRFYVNQNSVKELAEKKLLTRLLFQSFLYHLAAAVQQVVDEKTGAIQENAKKELAVVMELEDYKQLKDNRNNIFAMGLARKRDTSKALKYLACFGLTCNLRPTFGNEFEEMTALHYLRFMETQGYKSHRITLKYAWPPKRTKGDIVDAIHGLKKILECQKVEEMTNLKEKWEIPQSGRWCLVFSQATANAQSGDVFALLVDVEAKVASLETIQCKHYGSKRSSNECCSWWNSLGVSFSSDNVDLSPKEGSAGYSYLGLEKFRDLLSEWLSMDVKLHKRTLAVSFKACNCNDFPIPENDVCRVWFREMCEPTISVLEPRE